MDICHFRSAPLETRSTVVISIRIENLTKRFGDSIALHSLDLTIGAGEIFFLLGPSGCGKTTLLRSIAGFYPPDEGRIFFGDEDVTGLPPHERNTGMMFQSYALWPHMTVAQNVAFGLEERRVARSEIDRRVVAALESVRMEPYAARRINQLSGGQQQRVALARAMVIRPRCLLLDEPLSNLDTKLRIEMRGEIRRICKEAGLTAVYVTHDQKEALSVGDRIAVMEAGHIRQTGVPAGVYRQPASRFIADFMGETNFIEGIASAPGADSVTVRTSLGNFIASAHGWQPQAGQNVLLSVRPEAIRLSTFAEAINSIPGSIRERVYLGEMAQYRFAAGDGDRMLKVFELNPKFAFGNDRRELFASADPADVVVLPE
jgi:iron(III) transport system ATP-binding protein